MIAPIVRSAALRAAARPAFRQPVRFNSQSSASRASRIVEMAAQAERPQPMEAAVPVLWAVCGGLIYAAWNRVDEKSGSENVEKLLIV